MKKKYILWALACIAFFAGCSAGKNTTGMRAYHELTTRYNIYFNAEEAYREILKERSENFREDYAELLPFYPSLSDAEKSAPGGPFDPVIDKTGKAILEHSITAKPHRDPSKAHSQEYRQWLRQEEFNPFLKNVWMLRGKAYLQNGDHDEALSVFSGMLRLFSHDADLVNETEVWMLRTYAEMGRAYEAEKTAYTLKNRRLPKHLEKLFNEHYTYFLIWKKDFAGAIPHLRKTIAQEPGHFREKRLQFLLGQLYAMTGEESKAYRAFEEVKGLRTSFETTLNATLWQSALAPGEQQQKIMRQLKKMGKKINNTDSLAFLDQRYRIYLKAGNDSLAQAFEAVRRDETAEIEEKNGQETEKIVSLETPPVIIPPEQKETPIQPKPVHQIERETPEALKRKLEENAAKALQQQQETAPLKNGEQSLKERERQREERIRQRERELKERQRKREAELKQRERERKQKINGQK